MRLNPFRRSRLPIGETRSEDGVFYPAGTRTPRELRVSFDSSETRAIVNLPWNQGGPGPSTQPGVSQDQALSVVAVYSAVRLLADSIASLPLKAYRKTGIDGVPTELPLPSLFVQPAVNGTLYDWLHRCVSALALRGNAYGLITASDSYGYPTMVEWLDPDMIYVLDRALDGPGSFLQPQWFWRGRLLPAGAWKIGSTQGDLVHVPWFTVPYRVQGLSPIGAYAATIGTAASAQQYSNDWFAAGGVPPGKFRNSERVFTEADGDVITARVANRIRRRLPLVMGKDWDYTPMATPPEESQFIETLRLTASQIAAIYGVPADMIAGSTGDPNTYANVEMKTIQFVTFALRPWLAKLEAAFSTLLPRGQYVQFDVDHMIRADTLARHQVYEIDAKMGLRTIDEMRAVENWKPLGEKAAPVGPQAQGSPQPPQPKEPTNGHVPSTVPMNGRALAEWAPPR